ncbi:unnamed protein product [Ascophyllum nodosum]
MVIHVDGVRGKGDRSGDLCDRMSKKIRSQATELADLTERLQRHEAYSRLVETRLLELDPSHSLPVTPRDLDSGTSGGRNRSKRSSSVHEQVDAYSRRGARGGETDESMREGYHAAQERLKDAAQLIRQLREALASRDAEAKAAVERARKLHREVSDLRRRSGNCRCGGGAASEGCGDPIMEATGGSPDYLRREAPRLKRELQEQQKACTAAKAEGAKLKAALELRCRDLGLGQGGAGVAAELAAARSNINNLRAEVARLRLKPSSAGPTSGGSSGARQARGNIRQSNNTCIERSKSTGYRDAYTDWGKMGPRTRFEGQGKEYDSGAGAAVAALGAEKEALLDYVQDLLDKIKDLETVLSSKGAEHTETLQELESLKEDLRRADLTIANERRDLEQNERDIQEVREKMSQMQEDGVAQRSEKDEMARLYDELLRQLKSAEEEKEQLQTKARQAARREENEVETARSLREQLDQCSRRLAEANSAAAERVRCLDEEVLAGKNALALANSRLAKLDGFETEVIKQAKELKASRDELQALKDAASTSALRLAKLETLEADAEAAREELKRCQKEKRGIEEDLVGEKARTLHLVGAIKDLEVKTEAKRSREKAAASRVEGLQEDLQHRELKVQELTLLCEELEKRVVCLQSGEEVKGFQRQVEEAFGLAEKQDELLENASARMVQLKDESRDLRENLHRAEGAARDARNILQPAVAVARSRLRLGCIQCVGDLDHDHGYNNNRGQRHGAAPHDYHWDADTAECEEPGSSKAPSLEGLAREAAEALTQLLADKRGVVSGYGRAPLDDEAGSPLLDTSKLVTSSPRAKDAETVVRGRGYDGDSFGEKAVELETPAVAPEATLNRAANPWMLRSSSASETDSRVGGCWGNNKSRGRAGNGVRMPDQVSVRRMEVIRRGSGSESGGVGGVKSRRRGYLGQGQRSRPSAKEGLRCWTTFSLGGQSPSTVKIRKRIHQAQAALRSIQSTTD